MDNDGIENLTPEQSKKWSVVALAIGVVTYFVAQIIFDLNRAAVSALLVSCLVYLTRLYWRLSKEIWFWILMTGIFALDVMGVFLMPVFNWSNSFVVLAPIFAAQFAISIFLISTVEAAIRRRSGSMMKDKR